MRCPFCGAEETRVIDSRLAGGGSQVRRRRECSQCHERYTTFETADLEMPRVLKRDERREPFSIDKLRSGIMHAFEKRPVSTDHIERVVDHVRRMLLSYGDREVPSSKIGEWVMNDLRDVDQVAYVRFASVYRSFTDVQEFRDIIDNVEKQLSPEMRKSQLSLISEN